MDCTELKLLLEGIEVGAKHAGIVHSLIVACRLHGIDLAPRMIAHSHHAKLSRKLSLVVSGTTAHIAAMSSGAGVDTGTVHECWKLWLKAADHRSQL